jgi:hypothetical protein
VASGDLFNSIMKLSINIFVKENNVNCL